MNFQLLLMISFLNLITFGACFLLEKKQVNTNKKVNFEKGFKCSFENNFFCYRQRVLFSKLNS